jgi:hypothetical protein
LGRKTLHIEINAKEKSEQLRHAKEMYQYCLDIVKKYQWRAGLYKKRIEKLENEKDK